MTVEEYIQSRLESLKRPLPKDELKSAPADIIYAKLMSKKFRKMKAGQPCIDITKRAIERAIKNKTPIVISMCFGGNKLWRFDEAPEVEWAELFSLLYYLEFAKTVAAVYERGARLDYFSQDISVETLDNISREELDAYSNTFKEMIEWIKPYLPPGVTVTYRRHREMFKDEADYYKELEESKTALLAKNNGQLPELTDQMKTRTELNVRLKPGQDEDPAWYRKVELQHQALFMTKTLKTYFTDPDMIFLCPTYYQDSIVTGSTKRSIAKFWAALGVLQRNGDKYNELVLTPKQLETAELDWVPVKLKGLDNKNFSKVRILK